LPASFEERRFVVLDVSDEHMQDSEYFGVIIDEMENGGRGALMKYLLEYDLSGINLRQIPQTEGLLEQKLGGMTPVQNFWYECLIRGAQFTHEYEWHNTLDTQHLYTDYIEFGHSNGAHIPITDSEFGKQLKALCPSLDKIRIRANGRRYQYTFPSLSKCRTAFDIAIGFNISWPDMGECEDNNYDAIVTHIDTAYHRRRRKKTKSLDKKQRKRTRTRVV